MADILLPQPGDEITSDWGQSVADGLNSIQSGTVQISASNVSNSSSVITFPKPYATPPVVLVSMGPGNGYTWIAAYTDLFAHQFKALVFTRTGAAATATLTVSWLAIGDLA